MVHTDLKFFTNEPERDLYSRFVTILKSNTQFFDVLVGYFRASGFFKMYEALDQVEKRLKSSTVQRMNPNMLLFRLLRAKILLQTK